MAAPSLPGRVREAIDQEAKQEIQCSVLREALNVHGPVLVALVGDRLLDLSAAAPDLPALLGQAPQAMRCSAPGLLPNPMNLS